MAVQYHTVSRDEAGQRIDNFLLRYFKGVPKSVIYRILRKGEVRVDKKRVKPDSRLSEGALIRIPPVKVDAQRAPDQAPAYLLKQIEDAVMLEDDYIIVINKPAGLPVHGGTGVTCGLIEGFRQLRPNIPYVELVHRIDRETSGLVILAKSRKVLNELHFLLREGGIEKQYQTLVAGRWRGGRAYINLSLKRGEGNRTQKVSVDEEGKESESVFAPMRVIGDTTLMSVKILTGRMHQIRVQLQHLGFPILGDDRYGDFALNREYKAKGLNRMFLHAAKMEFFLEQNGQRYALEAPLPPELKKLLKVIEA